MLPSVVKNKIEQIWLDVIAGGVSQPTEVIEQLTYLMFAKQIDEREADIEMAELLSGEKQSHIFGESREEQALRWRNFKGMEARALHKHFVDRVFIFLINLNSNENSAFSRYLKHATFKINEPLALQKVVAGLEDLFENDIKDLDMQGDLYEYMLGKLNSAGRLGAFRTPKHIRDMMVKLMMPTPDMKICDPACGTAGFLISSAEYIRSEYGNKMTAEQWEKYGSETFTGFDTDETMCRLSCMNLMLHSVINPQLNKQDSVSKDYQVKDAYDLILANPPFKGTINKENINESLLAITNTTKTELLFVALFIRLLRVGGRCACIVPDGVLFGSSKAHKNLRKELIENQYLEAVISMPSGVFKPYAGVSTAILIFEVRLELRYVERYKERKQYECLEEIHKEEIIDHLAKLVVSDEKDEAAISFDVLMYGLMLSVMTGGKNLGRLKRYVVGNANILLKECATIPDIKVRISELKELVSDHYWDVQDVLKFEETRKSLREIMKYIPAKKEKLHYSNFKDIVVFREEGRLTSLSASDFEDYRAKVNEYVEAHKTTPAINKLLHNEPISVEDYNELERIFTVELGTAEDYEMNYQDTPFGLLIRKIAKMDRTAAYAAFSTFILEERPNTEQLHFIEQVVDYVVENGYINNVLDLMKTPFDRPYKFSLIFTYEEQVKFVKIINNIKNNALVT